jgi:hypothetical protein
MILPTTGHALPPWRRRVMIWVMGALRLAVAWLVTQQPLSTTVGPEKAVLAAVPAAGRWAIAAALVAGALAFAWSRTVVFGFALLAAGIVAFEWCWSTYVGPGGRMLPTALALLGALAAGEWLVRRVQRRVYSPPQA